VDEARVGGSDIVDENRIEQQVEMRISELGLASSGQFVNLAKN
jgi:hypothetical protein